MKSMNAPKPKPIEPEKEIEVKPVVDLVNPVVD
jgi:hypothetical protein